MFDRAAAAMFSPAATLTMAPEASRAAEREVLGVVQDQLRARKPPAPSPPPAQPPVPVEGESAGVRWGHKAVPAHASVVCFPVHQASLRPATGLAVPVRSTTLKFVRVTITDGCSRFHAFAAEGVEFEQLQIAIERSGAPAEAA